MCCYALDFLHRIGSKLAKCEVMVCVMVDGNKEGERLIYELEEVTKLRIFLQVIHMYASKSTRHEIKTP